MVAVGTRVEPCGLALWALIFAEMRRGELYSVDVVKMVWEAISSSLSQLVLLEPCVASLLHELLVLTTIG